MIDTTRLEEMEAALLPHDQNYFSRIQIPCNFNPDAECKRFFQFLNEIFPGEDEKDKITMIQRYLGYCFLPTARFQVSMFLYGGGANGKSVLLETIESVIGEDNCANLTIADLGQKFKLPLLNNKLLNIAEETDNKDPIAAQTFKTLVSGGKVSIEKKFGEPFVIKPFCRFMIAMNNVPIIKDKSHGMTRRLMVIEFKRRFQKHEMDNLLDKKLQAERDGVFFWGLSGLYQLLQKQYFETNEVVEEDTKNFIHVLNPLFNFIDEKCDLDSKAKVGCMDFYQIYKAWSIESGQRPMSKSNFYVHILSNYPKVKKYKETNRTGRWLFRGIGLID